MTLCLLPILVATVVVPRLPLNDQSVAHSNGWIHATMRTAHKGTYTLTHTHMNTRTYTQTHTHMHTPLPCSSRQRPELALHIKVCIQSTHACTYIKRTYMHTPLALAGKGRGLVVSRDVNVGQLLLVSQVRPDL